MNCLQQRPLNQNDRIFRMNLVSFEHIVLSSGLTLNYFQKVWTRVHTNGTNSPLCIISVSCFPLSDPDATSSRRRSPDWKWIGHEKTKQWVETHLSVSYVPTGGCSHIFQLFSHTGFLFPTPVRLIHSNIIKNWIKMNCFVWNFHLERKWWASWIDAVG